MPVEDFIISAYCLIDDLIQIELKGGKLRKRGFEPGLTDSEVITMEIVGEFLGIDTDKGIWEYFDNHWKSLFPSLGSRSNFARQAANLWQLKQSLQKKLAEQMGAFSDSLHMSDGFPMPSCHFKRAYFSPLFEGEATYGYCASKGENYYGFKGNLVINSQGIITGITVTQANVDERDSLWDLLDKIEGMMISDKGLIGADYQKELLEYAGINLQTAVRSNMKETRSKSFIKWLKSTRRLIETVIGQLAERFHIEKIRARDLWHLTSRVARKVLSHTVCAFLNKALGNPALQFERLIQA